MDFDLHKNIYFLFRNVEKYVDNQGDYYVPDISYAFSEEGQYIKYYCNNRGKGLSAFVIGTESIENGVYFAASHIDSPRVDLKAHPLYETLHCIFLTV